LGFGRGKEKIPHLPLPGKTGRKYKDQSRKSKESLGTKSPKRGRGRELSNGTRKNHIDDAQTARGVKEAQDSFSHPERALQKRTALDKNAKNSKKSRLTFNTKTKGENKNQPRYSVGDKRERKNAPSSGPGNRNRHIERAERKRYRRLYKRDIPRPPQMMSIPITRREEKKKHSNRTGSKKKEGKKETAAVPDREKEV